MAIKKIEAGKKTIIVVDYSNLKDSEMILLVDDLKRMILSENKQQLILSLYNKKNFATPRFMRHVEKATQEVVHLIDKMAIVGITDIQKFILKAYNLLLKRNYPAFDTQEEAIQYLVDESRSTVKQ